MSVPIQQAPAAARERATLRRPKLVAVWAVWLVAIGLALVGLIESLLAGPANAGLSIEALLLVSIVALLLVVSTTTVGSILATRVPHNVVGWLLLAGGLAFALNVGFGALADYGLNVRPGSVPGAVWFAVLGQATNGIYIGVLGGYVPLYFPTGELPSRRWWPVPILAAVPTFLAPVASLLVPLPSGSYPVSLMNPLAVGGPAGQALALFVAISTPIGVLALVLVIASLVSRYRQSRGIERAQIKWFAVAAVGVILAIAVAVPFGGFNSGPFAVIGTVAWLAAILGMAVVPLAIGIAVLRYRLFEIDRLLSRTIAYGVLTLMLALLFVGVVLGLQALLVPFTGSNTLAVAGSTLLVAALFQPLRERVRRLVDRRFNRSRYDAERTVAALAERLRDQLDLAELRTEIAGAVTRTVEPASVSLWLRA